MLCVWGDAEMQSSASLALDVAGGVLVLAVTTTTRAGMDRKEEEKEKKRREGQKKKKKTVGSVDFFLSRWLWGKARPPLANYNSARVIG